MFNESTLHEIRNRLDLVHLVSEYVSLKKAGRNWKGLCPFHQEKTPSFIVSEEKQIFHCFGCHEGGDLFGFLMKVDGLSFPEAVEILANKAGVALEAQQGKPSLSTNEKEALYQANRIAAWHYHENLKKSPAAEKARAYLAQRGLNQAEVEKFRLGFSLSHSEPLIESLEQRGVSLEAAQKVGVLRKGERGYYETFRDRLIFPIFNRDNKVVGLGGRIIEAKEDTAKYINSAESPIYNKSCQLFGLSYAKEAIRKKNRVFVVEGYLDVIAMHQFGFEETVAPLGTALTSQQITILQRYTDEIIVLFDADEAGWKAALRSCDLFLEQKLSPKVLILPLGEDPDTFLRRYGAQTFKEKLKEVGNLLSLIIDKTLAQKSRDIAGRSAALEELKPYLSKLKSSLEKNLYVRKIAQDLDVPEGWIFEELGWTPMSGFKTQPNENQNVPPPTAEEILLEIFIKFDELRQALIDKIDPVEFINIEYKALAEFLWNQVGKTPLSLTEMMTRIQEPQLHPLLTKLALKDTPMEAPVAATMAHDCVKKIKIDRLKQKLGEISIRIKDAETHQRNDQVADLMKEKADLAKEQKAIQSGWEGSTKY